MNEELISVVVPIFRVEKYLSRCIDSIINQTYKNIEIILVDDGSDDGCPYICDNYSKCDKRIVVYHKKNGGLSDARNYGIERANGDYLIFIDSDDYIDSTMIQKLYLSLKNNNADICICPFVYVDEMGKELSNQKNIGRKGVFSNEEIFHMYDVSNVSWILGVAWNKLYKREIFLEIRYPKGKLHEDNFISFLLYEKARKISIIDEKLYFYTQRQKSIMGDQYNVRHADNALASLNMIEFARKTQRLYLIPKAERQAFYTLFSIMIRIKKLDDKQYLMPIIKKYSEIYHKVSKYCDLGIIETIKRNILIKHTFALKICNVINRIFRQ